MNSRRTSSTYDNYRMTLKDLSPNLRVYNQDIVYFHVSPQGGMRRHLNYLVLITKSFHMKKDYPDRWQGNVLYYVGMGRIGELIIKVLIFSQNKTLKDSNLKNIHVILFVKYDPGKYLYLGRVKLIKTPYLE